MKFEGVPLCEPTKHAWIDGKCRKCGQRESEMSAVGVVRGSPAEWATIGEVLSTKETNPKDAIGSAKLDMGLVPDTAVIAMALAFTEGALKYGRYNWRVAGVRASIYHAALRRHAARYWNGEWADPATGVPHLASIMACCAILIDAHTCRKLTDDRPPRTDLGPLFEMSAAKMLDLRALLKDFDPHQYTIADGQEPTP